MVQEVDHSLLFRLPLPLAPPDSLLDVEIQVSRCLRFITASPCHHVTALVSHLPFPLPPSQSVICLAPATKPVSHLPCPLPLCHHVAASLCHHITVSPHHCVTTSLRHRVSQSFALPPATKPVSHLPCPLPPSQSVICLAPATKPVSHLPCPLPPHHRITTSLC